MSRNKELDEYERWLRPVSVGELMGKIGDLAAENGRLRRALEYVLDDEPNLVPRASSACRDHIRDVLAGK